MKNLRFISILVLAASCTTSQQMTATIPANDQVELTYPEYELAEVSIKNRSLNTIEVAVLEQDDRDFVRGFGLGKLGGESVMLEKENTLVLRNDSNTKVKVKVSANESTKALIKEGQNIEYVSFTLQNTTAKSIPLIIPNVMNPNLSPFSKSGVDLIIGQEIFFKEGGKKYVLLVVDNSISNGSTLNVSQLLKERKKELGI